MEACGSSSKSIGLVQKCGGSGTVLPCQRTTRVRISVILMKRPRSEESGSEPKVERTEPRQESWQTQPGAAFLRRRIRYCNRDRDPADIRPTRQRQSLPPRRQIRPVRRQIRRCFEEKGPPAEP